MKKEYFFGIYKLTKQEGQTHMAIFVKNIYTWRKIAFICATSSILLFIWLFGAFVGIESKYTFDASRGITFHPIGTTQPYNDGGELFFLKRAPSSRVIYNNIVNPGNTDLRPLEMLDEYSLSRFQELCKVKYNISDIDKCYQIFR
jgi:hypothetical protein